MFKIFFFFFTLLFFIVNNANGQAREKNLAPGHLQIAHKASLRPDRIFLSYAQNNLFSPTVTWRTSGDGTISFLQYAKVGDTVDFYKSKEVISAQTTAVTAIDEMVCYHKASFKDLMPGQQYAYRVGNNNHWSEWIQIRIPKTDGAEPYSFIYLGDAQNDLFPLWSRVVRQAYAKAPDAHFILHAGDMINHAENNYEWGEWFEAASFIFKMVPQFVVAGNHEYVKNAEGKKVGISPLYDPQFNYPANGLSNLGDTNYFMDYPDLKLIVLNSNEAIAPQAKWLDEVLQKNAKKWVVVSFHHPVISGAKGRVNEGIMKNWKPVLDKHKVDLVLQGHDHVYARGNTVNSGLEAWDEETGTVYVVSVSGRKMYPLSDHPWMQRKAENTQTYQIITIDGNKLMYTSYTTEDVVFDSFILKKRGENKKNTFKEMN